MSQTGVRIECLRVQGQLRSCEEPIWAGPPVWVEELASPGYATNAVPGTAVSLAGPTPAYVLRVTAHEAVYVLVGKGDLAPTSTNGIFVDTWGVVNIAPAPGDRIAYALASGSAAETLAMHLINFSNPHQVSKAQVGLANVDNTADAAKPISTAVQTALDTKLAIAAYTAADVLAKLLTVDGSGSGLDADLFRGVNALARANHTGTQTAATISDFATVASAAAPVQSVAGRTGAVTLAKTDVGLANVDNTSDVDKPVGTATQTALNGKAALGANNDITSLGALSTAITVAQGGTGAGNATTARSNLSAAKSGANSDITSLTGLTTALSLAQGGTGATDAATAATNLASMKIVKFTSASISFGASIPAVTAASSANYVDTSVTITGVVDGDTVLAWPSGTITAQPMVTWVSAVIADTVKLRTINCGGNAFTPATRTWYFLVLRSSVALT